MKVIAVVPAYNEGKNIEPVVINTKKYVDEVIVVDDGSSDRTYEVAVNAGADHVYKHVINMGKGLAMSTGFEAALSRDADVVIFIDADGQHEPSDIKRLVAKLNDSNLDLVTAVRNFDNNMPFVFRFGNNFLVNAFNILFKSNIKDLSNGLRAIRTDVYGKIRWYSPRYSVETEMLANAAKHKLRIGQMPIETKYLDRYKGTTVLDGVQIFLKMLLWKVRR